MKKNERLHALKILINLIENQVSLAHQMPTKAELTPLTKAICFGVCRHYFRLEAILDCLVNKRPKETTVWIALMMGIYQLHYMQQPDYAVVKETVDLLEKMKKGWAKGLVNAVLRNFCRQQPQILAKLSENPLFLHGQPTWLFQRLKNDWPDDFVAIATANDAHPPMVLRVNLGKNSLSDYLNQLTQAGMEAQPHPVAHAGILLASPCDVHQLPGFAEGLVSVQDGAAQLAESLLDLQAGHRVLDACCAPGGKTCHILESQPSLAECVGLDIDLKRLNRVQENLSRLNLTAKLVQGDALNPEIWWDGQLFDRILLDAPCSATGVIRRHADIKLLRTPEEVFAVTKIQQAMLKSMWPLLAENGRLVYGTCSVLAVENEQQIAQFVASQPDCQVQPIDMNWGRPTGHGRQILPGEQGMDGFFYSVLVKKIAVN